MRTAGAVPKGRRPRALSFSWHDARMTTGACRSALAAGAAALALVAAGCGSGGSATTTVSPPRIAQTPPQADPGPQRGGHLTVLYSGDVDYIDPGETYYPYGYNVAYATQRPLYSYRPESRRPVPDLAAGPARVSDGGRTITIRIRRGIRYSPPYAVEVTAADVKYALERAFSANVANGYAPTYLSEIVGAPRQPGPYQPIPGIVARGRYTLVIHLRRPRPTLVLGALSLPVSAPVPQAYAAPYDAQKPSAYGMHELATGPYMIQSDPSGKVVGYQPGQQLLLVRNPSWRPDTDYRPAYLDSVTIQEGTDPTVASRRIELGTHQASGDFQIPGQVLQDMGSPKYRDDFVVSPATGRVRFVALNTAVTPFDDVNVRRAVLAAFDRVAMRQAFGGPATGIVASHFIPPGVPGFLSGGGMQGPGLPWVSNPSGDLTLARAYLRRAGYPDGRYTGTQPLLMVADNSTDELNAARVAQAQLQKLGFQIQLQAVSRRAMYQACGTPSRQVAICPSVGWLKDFGDAETVLDLTFDGHSIVPRNNSNWSQLDDPRVNRAIAAANAIQDPARRAAAWGTADRLITASAAAVPWLWDTPPLLKSADVDGVVNKMFGWWDLSFTSVR